MLVSPGLCIEAASSGLLLWFNKVLPSLLPFIILVNLLVSSESLVYLQSAMNKWTQKLWGLPGGSFLSFILGLIAGYPMGAKVTKELYEKNYLSLREAQKTLCFTNNCGPLFIVGTVGTLLLRNTSLGYFLLFIHFLSAFILSLCLRSLPLSPRGHKAALIQAKIPPSFATLFNEAVKGAMDTIVYVGAYIIFFSVLVHLLLEGLPPLIHSFHFATSSNLRLFAGLLELSNGVNSLCQASLPLQSCLPQLSFILGFGGLCVYFQTSYVLEDAPFSLIPYFFCKLAQGLLGLLLTEALYPFWLWQKEKKSLHFPIYWWCSLLLFVSLVSLLVHLLPFKTDFFKKSQAFSNK